MKQRFGQKLSGISCVIFSNACLLGCFGEVTVLSSESPCGSGYLSCEVCSIFYWAYPFDRHKDLSV